MDADSRRSTPPSPAVLVDEPDTIVVDQPAHEADLDTRVFETIASVADNILEPIQEEPRPSIDMSGTPMVLAPVVHVVPNTPPQEDQFTTQASAAASSSSSSKSTQSHESTPQAPQRSNTLPVLAPQPTQPFYYATPQPVYTVDPSRPHVPLTSSPSNTPPPQTQFVQFLPSGSSPALPLQYIVINGQTMLVQPLPVQAQPVAHLVPSPTGTPQPTSSTSAIQNQPQPQPQYVILQSPVPTPPSISQGPPQPSVETIPPPVPPKPASIQIQPPLAQQIYLPTPINTSITAQMNAASVSPSAPEPGPSSIQPEASTNIDMPGAFPATAHPQRQSSLPTHVHQTNQQPRRLSWDYATYSPPSTTQGRRERTVSNLNAHVPPLTPIGSGPYPPLGTAGSATTPGEGRSGERRDYFSSPHSANGRPEGQIQRPQRAHSQRRDRDRGERERVESLRRSTYPNGTFVLDDYPASPGRHDPIVYAGDLVPVAGAGSTNRLSRTNTTATIPREGAGNEIGYNGDDGQRRGGLLGWLGIGSGGRPPAPQRRVSALLEKLKDNTQERTIIKRLTPTLEHAQEELERARMSATATGWSLNVAIGAQVILGALTTGVAAATSGRKASIATSILGGLSTLAASYLAKARGSGEPEASSGRCKDLENFVRELENVLLDRGDLSGEECDELVRTFRGRFEKIMGNDSGGILSHVGDMLRERMDAVVHGHGHAQGQGPPGAVGAQGNAQGGQQQQQPQPQQHREHV